MKKASLEYVSKRLVARGSEKAFKAAADKAIKANGYVVVVKNGWIVKEYLNGNIEPIKEIDSHSISQDLVLD